MLALVRFRVSGSANFGKQVWKQRGLGELTLREREREREGTQLCEGFQNWGYLFGGSQNKDYSILRVSIRVPLSREATTCRQGFHVRYWAVTLL